MYKTERAKRRLAKEKIIVISVMSIHLILTVAAVFGSYLVLRAFQKFHSL